MLVVSIFTIFNCGKNSNDDSFAESVKNQMDKTSEIAEKLSSGEINIADAEKALAQQGIAFKDMSSKEPPKGMPDWVKKIGFIEPAGMKYMPELSSETSIKNTNQKFDSITLVYTGDWETAKNETIKIAKKVKIPSMPGADETTVDEMGIISFSNFSNTGEDSEFIMSITAERDKGMLTIDVANNSQMKKAIEQFQK